MNSDIEEIKTRLNVVDVLGGYIRLEKAGSNYRALCPFHNEKSPSFMVNEEKQFWHCFGCQKSGDIFSFVMEMEGLEFREALKMLAERAGVELQGFDKNSEVNKNRTMEILELATKFYEVQLLSGAGKIKIVNYLKDRGFSLETIKEFRLGYAPAGWRNILDFLVKRGYKKEEIEKTGLLVKKDNGDFYDRFRSRVMFPIADSNGKVVGFSARVEPGGDESQAKYVNTPETEVYHKSKALYGINLAKAEIKKKNEALLVEGNADVVACHQAGIKNTIAVSGTALTPDQMNILKRYTKNIKMFFDMDSAGQNATKKSVKLALSLDFNVKIVSIEGGKDAADLAKSNPEELKKAVESARPFMEYFFDLNLNKFDRKSAEGKRKITEELLDMIGNVANGIEKAHWVKKLSQELSVPESVLTDELKKATLEDRKPIASREEKKSLSARTKIEMLLENLIGLLLVKKEAWQKILSEKELFSLFFQKNIFRVMVEKGETVAFDFERLLELLDEKEKLRVQELFFEKKYRLGLNNVLEEVSLDDWEKELNQIIFEIRKESRRQMLEKIIQDLRSAEEAGDKEAQIFLRQESSRLAQELAGLV